MTLTGKWSCHCFMNAYRAVTPWQSTRSLFLRYRAPYASRPTPYATEHSLSPGSPLNALQELMGTWMSWWRPSNFPTFLWVLIDALLLFPVTGLARIQV